MPDFKKGLGPDLSKELELQEFRTRLEGGHAANIADALWRAGASDPRPDAIVLMRGGGKKVMLERFSNEHVLEAAAEVGSRIPLCGGDRVMVGCG